MGGARRYVTLFEAPFQASVLTDNENNALRASSLMVIPPPPLGSQPLARSTAVDLMGNYLTQWASDVQEVTSYMQWPPEAAARCPLMDIIGVLNWLEGLARVQYCRSCCEIGQRCQCSVVPYQAPGPMAALWTPPTVSYAAMVSSTETTGSTSVAGVTPPSHRPPGMPVLEPMDTLPAPTMENLLATAGISQGHKPQTLLQAHTAPGLRQTRPKMPQQQVPTPRGQEAMQAMPYRQQVFPPQCPAPPHRAPSPVPARITRSWPEKREVPGVGPCPEGLRTGKEGADSPPEDPRSADGVIPVTVSWTRWPTMWPQGGSET